MGTLGVLFGLATLIVAALRGVNILIVSLIAAGIVAVSNGQSWAEAFTVHYTGAMMGFAGAFFILFLTGAIFGRVMADSGAAQSIGLTLRQLFGDERALLIIVLASAGLTYGGVNVFIVVFALYPLGLGIVARANLPKRLLVAATGLGAATFTMTALPASPSIQNNISANTLGTPLTAQPVLGIIAAIIMFGLGMAYLNWQTRVARTRGEGFVPSAADALGDDNPEPRTLPGWQQALIPLGLVVACIVAPRLLIGTVADIGEPRSNYDSLLAFTAQQPLLWTGLALVVGILSALVLLRRFLPNVRETLSCGAESSALPLLNTAAVIGFGGVVRQTAVFDAFANAILSSDLPPLVSATLSVNVMAGIVGSASGGLQIWMSSFAQEYLRAGIDPEVLHRVATVASGGLDSLPHCGGVITMFTVMGVTHRQAYKDFAAVTVVTPVLAAAVIVALVLALGY